MTRGNSMIKCPICQNQLQISQFSCSSCRTSYEGHFVLPRLARMSKNDRQLAEAFLFAGGNLKDLAEHLGISYPTVRKQVDAMMDALRQLRDEDQKHIEQIMSDMEAGRVSGSEGLRLIKEINGEL